MIQPSTSNETSAHVITLTPPALEKAHKFLSEEAEPQGKAFRVSVNSGGCSGFSYAVAIDLKKPDDVVQSYPELNVVVDPVSLQFLKGLTVGYEDSVGHAGFTFENPQASSSCGCGNSFDVTL